MGGAAEGADLGSASECQEQWCQYFGLPGELAIGLRGHEEDGTPGFPLWLGFFELTHISWDQQVSGEGLREWPPVRRGLKWAF